MGVLDKFLDAIKLNDDYDDDGFLDDDLLDEEEDDDFLDDDFDEKPKKKFFDKFSKKKESDDNDDFDDVEEKTVKTVPKQASAPKQTASAPSKVTVKQERAERQTRPAASSKITPMRSSRKSNQGPNMEVCVIKPSSMEDTREIADTLVDNSTVILNLEGIDVELAQRIIHVCVHALRITAHPVFICPLSHFTIHYSCLWNTPVVCSKCKQFHEGTPVPLAMLALLKFQHKSADL